MICKLCGSREYKNIYKKEGYDIVKCAECNLYYVLNPMQELDSRLYYNKLYTEGSYKTEGEIIHLKYQTLKSFIKFFPTENRTALDVGCGEGLLVKLLKNLGWRAYGIDFVPVAVKNSNLNYEDIIIGNFEEINLPENSFDLITMIDSLEHFYDPAFVLKKIYKIMKNTGSLFITTPNIKSLYYKLFRKHWVHLRPREHLFYFSPHTISELLKKSGFEPIKIGRCFRKVNINFLINRIYFHYPGIYKYVKQVNYLPANIRKMPFNFYSGELFVLAKKSSTGVS